MPAARIRCANPCAHACLLGCGCGDSETTQCGTCRSFADKVIQSLDLSGVPALVLANKQDLEVRTTQHQAPSVTPSTQYMCILPIHLRDHIARFARLPVCLFACLPVCLFSVCRMLHNLLSRTSCPICQDATPCKAVTRHSMLMLARFE